MCTGAYVCLLFLLVIKALALLKYIRFISSEVNLQGSLTNGTCLHYIACVWSFLWEFTEGTWLDHFSSDASSQ